MNSPITVRPLISEDEKRTFFRIAFETFSEDLRDPDPAIRRWRNFVEASPYYDAAQVRGVFRGDEQLGGYIIYEWLLSIGPATLWAGCLSAVVTFEPYRKQGVASAMLHDAIAFAEQRRLALLYLMGIPNFYHRFGFADVLEATRLGLKLADIVALPASPLRVRPATLADAPALLNLYHRASDPYPGGFARTLAMQEHRLRGRVPDHAPLVAFDADDAPTGYLILPWRRDQPDAVEVVAEDWPTALALLKAHAAVLNEAATPPEKVWWPVPPQSPLQFALADHVAGESITYLTPNREWMARPAHLPAFFEAILPLWRQRWQQSAQPWRGIVSFAVADHVARIEFGARDVRLCDDHPAPDAALRMTPQALVQWLFGFRPLDWLARQPGQTIPPDLIPFLQTLAPDRSGWIPGSDHF